ncbi:hypothetical protein ACPWT1_17360 [Ramlibacter sp. MMS24-I3-19]|uniref:hypothetical protein n=1 Tax=Ramlibacter sp. MMS24-I3-19 TaxID=3416606 RepID=UPI003D0244DE
MNSTRMAYSEWLAAHDELHAANSRFADGVAAQLPEGQLLDLAHRVAVLQEKERDSLTVLSRLHIWARRDAVARPFVASSVAS